MMKQEQKNGLSVIKVGLGVLILLALLGATFWSGMWYSQLTTKPGNILSTEQNKERLSQILGQKTNADKSLSKEVDFNLFWEVWNLLKTDYVKQDTLNEKNLFYGAVRGLVAAAGDPYTIFLDPKDSKTFADDLAGTFEGIGAEIGIKKEQLVVIAPLPETPAEKAGLRAGDKILAIDKQATMGISVDEAVSKIRGKKGTVVTLIINRPGEDKNREIKITREVIIVKSVKTNLRKDGVMVITITSFNSDTALLFEKAVQEAEKTKPKAIILDLRNNPGGYLNTAVEVASNWIDSGPVVIEQDSKKNRLEYPAVGLARLQKYKTVVLINQGSASASEIVAGALQDDSKARIIGAQSFGKGSVQTLEKLSDGSSLKVTIAQWLTPKGTNISEKGITPDQAVELTAADYEKSKDPQMDAAIKWLFPLGKK
ncbi:MAG: S41 family peptidase [Candidatus Falkowbacteria bacterium]